MNSLLKSENYHVRNLSKTYLVNICFALPARIVPWDSNIYFCLKICNWLNSFIFIWNKVPWFETKVRKGVSIPSFVVRIFLDLKCEVVRREYGFSINSKTSFMSSGDKPFLTLKISVASFCRFLWECSKSYPL